MERIKAGWVSTQKESRDAQGAYRRSMNVQESRGWCMVEKKDRVG